MVLLKLLKNQTIHITAGHKVNLRWGLTQYKSFVRRSTTHPAQDLCSGVTLACVRKDCSNRAVHHIVSTHTHEEPRPAGLFFSRQPSPDTHSTLTPTADSHHHSSCTPTWWSPKISPPLHRAPGPLLNHSNDKLCLFKLPGSHSCRSLSLSEQRAGPFQLILSFLPRL